VGNLPPQCRIIQKHFFVGIFEIPKLDVLDLGAISRYVELQKFLLLVIIRWQRQHVNPIKHGANIVIHSHQYIGGQGNSLGGVIDAGTFNWANREFPEFTETFCGVSWISISMKL
jgi:O-acetylhomoserine (thiol)-lyase